MTKQFKVGDTVEVIANTAGREKSAGWHIYGQGVVNIGAIGAIESIKEDFANIKFDKKDINGFTKNDPYRKLRFDEIKLIETKRTKNQRITALEESFKTIDGSLIELREKNESLEKEVAELKVIVEGLRKNKFHVEVDAETVGRAVVGTLENVIGFEGAKYRKVEREAREGDVVIPRGSTSSWVLNDEKYLVEISGKTLVVDRGGCDYFAVYHENFNRTPETVDVYERIMPSTVEEVNVQHETLACSAATPKTANELRAEIIEKAKQFIENTKTSVTGKAGNGTDKGEFITFENVYSVHEIGIRRTACNAEFIVNEGKRTIVALLRGVDTNKIYHRGIAKCMPDDVFNEHIGKAIALGRALDLDVSEFEQAVQPTVAVGQILGFKDGHLNTKYRVNNLEVEFGNLTITSDEDINIIGSSADGGYLPKGEWYKIINDTHAIYGGVE